MRSPLVCCGLVTVAVLSGCPKPAPTPAPDHPGGGSGVKTPDAIDAPGPSQEEKLAAIQKAMNELDEAVQTCWAVVATERFDVEGDLIAQISIEMGETKPVGAATANATLVQDTARNPKLAACVVDVFEHYPWAPPLRGDTIQLPFRVRHPDDGQNVIDRRLVSASGQGNIRVSVLLDENNNANDQASMFEIAIADKGSTGMRRTERAELWYFITAASMKTAAAPIAVAAGDMVFVPAQGVRDVVASSGAITAMLVVTPGGPEGSARGGALPTPEAGSWKKTPPIPVLLSAKNAKTYPRGAGKVTIFSEAGFGASILEFPSGMVVPEHVHEKETEMLYVLSGAGTMTVKGVALAVTATSVVQVPPNTKHAFTTASDLKAIQIYTPAGPEQRFKAK